MNKKHAGGRPTKYNKEFHPLLVKAFAKNGMTDVEIAKELGIDEKTITNWKKKYKEFFLSLKEGKESKDDQVENSLLRRALGCTVKETRKGTSDKKGEYKEEIEREIAPETIACIFWLKNRRPGRWRDRQELSIPELSEYQESISKMTIDELKKELKKIDELEK